jgi:hypothetical protein
MGPRAAGDLNGDSTKLSYACEVSTWYTSIEILKNHARAVRAAANHEEYARLPDLHRPLIENLVWAMGEARDSPDPYQRARWYMYQNRDKLCVDYVLDRLVPVLPLAPLFEMVSLEMEQQQQMEQQQPMEQQQQQIEQQQMQVETGTSSKRKKKQHLRIMGLVRRSLRLLKLREELQQE